MKLLQGTALITGAGSGIGRAVAVACAREGCRSLVLADVNLAGSKETEDLIQKDFSGIETLTIQVDISDAAAVVAMVSRTVETFGSLDHAFNVAGISVESRVPSVEYPLAEYDAIQNINARGLLLCTKEEIKAMLRQPTKLIADYGSPERAQRGSIVNIASTCGFSVISNMLPYVAAKHAVVGITRAAAIDHASDQIRINAVCPGLVETPMIEARRKQEQDRAADSVTPRSWQAAPMYNTPIGRLALAEEVADTCIFLSSSMASHITASTITVDGGRSAVF